MVLLGEIFPYHLRASAMRFGHRGQFGMRHRALAWVSVDVYFGTHWRVHSAPRPVLCV